MNIHLKHQLYIIVSVSNMHFSKAASHKVSRRFFRYEVFKTFQELMISSIKFLFIHLLKFKHIGVYAVIGKDKRDSV